MMKFINRVYNDYFMNNRYEEYETLIKTLIENNYSFIRICDYKMLKKPGKHVILRHDIDSDLKIAKKMFEIEKKYNVFSTFYFRQSTFDKDFMKEIYNYGSEVGYHYEELATFCKENKISSRDDALSRLNEMKKVLIFNIQQFEKDFNIKLSSIASHGDFYNRKMNLENRILFDTNVRKIFSNVVEAYDDVIEKNIDSRIADCMYPKFWNPRNPINDINHGKRNILLLIHTRWWDKNPLERMKLELLRILKR